MKKNNFAIPLFVVVIVVSLILFIIPYDSYNFTSYLLLNIFFLVFNVCSYFLIMKNTENNLKKDIYNLPLFKVFLSFDFLIFILLLIFRFIEISVIWSVIAILIVSALYFGYVYFVVLGVNHIKNKDDEIKEKTKKHDVWISNTERLIINNENDEMKKDLNDLLELIKYMDPVSSESTKEIDEKIDNIFEKLSKEVNKENLDKISKLLKERKVIIKNNK